jgi:hypothetical protein
MSDTVVNLRGHMTMTEYDQERSKLAAERKYAGAHFDQQLAKLFYRSGWTQEQLAAKEGKKQQWISRHILFGRFLSFTPTGVNSELTPNNLTEGRFRSYWDRTEKDGNERIRFRAVQQLIQDELSLRAKNRPKIGRQLVELFGDGKWHELATMAKAIPTEDDHVEETLRIMMVHETYGAKCERKQVGRSFQYRIFPAKQVISSQELITKLSPIIDGLRAEGKKNMATMSPGTVARLAHQLKLLLEGWTK